MKIVILCVYKTPKKYQTVKEQHFIKKTGFIVLTIVGTLVLIQLLGFVNIQDTTQTAETINTKKSENNYKVNALTIPTVLTFAGEDIPISRWYVKEKLDRELLVNTYWQSQTMLFLKRANRYMPMIEPILKEENVPDDFKYLALIESGFIPTIVSPARAVGLWQFMSGTARDYGLEVNKEVDERYNIEKATHAACKYLKDSYKEYGNWALVAASYNAGRNFINKQMKLQDAGSYFDLLLGDETERYMYRILAIKLIMENPKKYGFNYKETDLYPQIPTRKITLSTPVKNLALYAKQNGINYKLLKYFNPWLRKKNLTNKTNKTYEITLPAENYIDFNFSKYVAPVDTVTTTNKTKNK